MNPLKVRPWASSAGLAVLKYMYLGCGLFPWGTHLNVPDLQNGLMELSSLWGYREDSPQLWLMKYKSLESGDHPIWLTYAPPVPGFGICSVNAW